MRWLLVLLMPTAALAYDSHCELDGAPCPAGPLAARGSWIDGPVAGAVFEQRGDEHRRIFERAREMGGLPAALSDPIELPVFTSGAEVGLDEASVPSIEPVAFPEAAGLHRRQLRIGELAQLPDFSYSLWDWASGNETCPIDPALDPATCHEFTSHMGPVNSNHFLPQAASFYRHYHGLAMSRAEACAAMSAQLGASIERFRPFVLACEQQALMLEAVAQHYLQDAWSSGHMWHRWGSPDLADFPDPHPRARAVVVAAIAGMVHGSEPLLSIPDALCTPTDGVDWISDWRPAPTPGLGDLHLHRLAPAGSGIYQHQHDGLLSCTVASLRAVYGATAMQHGEMIDPVFADLFVPAPGQFDALCLSQRANNVSMAIAGGLGTDVVHLPFTAFVAAGQLGVAKAAQWLARFSKLAVPAFLATVDLLIGDAQRDLVAYDLAAVAWAVEGDGTQMARLPPDLLGVGPNHLYDLPNKLAPYTDPALPWPETADPRPGSTDRAELLARTFHRAHATDWCARTDLADLEAIRARVAASAGPARDAACSVCAEIVSRHTRAGTGAGDFDDTRPPLCDLLADAPARVYSLPVAAEGARSLALRWCGCAAGRLGGLALAERNTLWAVDPTATPPVAVSPCDGAGAPLEVDLGTAAPVGAARINEGQPAVVIHYPDQPWLAYVDAAACAELDFDDDPATTTPGAPDGVTRWADPDGRSIFGVAATVLDDGRRIALYTAADPDDWCDTRLRALDLDTFVLIGELDLGAHATLVTIAPSAPAIGPGPAVVVSMTGTPECFRAELNAWPLADILELPVGVSVDPHRFIFPGGGTHEPRRMDLVPAERLIGVTLGEEDGHLGVADLNTGEAHVLGDMNDLGDFWRYPMDVVGVREAPGVVRWIVLQRESNGLGQNGECESNNGLCAAVRTVRYTAADGGWEEGVEWEGPRDFNFTIGHLPGADRVLVAHHRIRLTLLGLLGGIHAFTTIGGVEGPGGTGVLFDYP